jgi:murein DD-endopeptidase MepM/ murein hydrolase activator NlpD
VARLTRHLSRAAAALAIAAAAGSAAGGTAPGYALAREAALREGRAVAALVRAGDVAALHARFSARLAAAVPPAEVERVLAEVGPLGTRTGESALPVSPRRRVYLADFRRGGRTVGLSVEVDGSGTIGAIALTPRQPLGRDPFAGRRLTARLSLPFRGTWWVFWGGPTERQNYHAVAADQRHAYDFVVWRDGSTHRGAGTRNADYWAWGRPLLAPADAVVVAVRDGVRDNRPLVELENRRAPAGNHVVLDLGRGEFALLAHMRRGSVRVRRGMRVRRGDVLGLCGNSGNSSEPHLHFHVQDRRELFGAARGRRVQFVGYDADGRRVRRGSPVQGQFVAPTR